VSHTKTKPDLSLLPIYARVHNYVREHPGGLKKVATWAPNPRTVAQAMARGGFKRSSEAIETVKKVFGIAEVTA
jgi:hypothetical protein